MDPDPASLWHQQVGGGQHAQVGSSLLTVQGVVPTSFSDDGSVLFGANGTEYIGLHGGSGHLQCVLRCNIDEWHTDLTVTN